ncbi:alpha/beta fold hydrolase [Cellulomonas sp. C5510]|uniref:alpha/beta fold hydrolase n=1 Tax=Cellulomonas sp. C5510 TaxID=2871170 RepID=UPI001C94A3EF|nr:alpha/beta fold hydrolase [Cellulomonas sp. C5510]QZN86515.1 alpha/beta fold hydrolase [Cellulomonas sp. C5510]
MTHTPHATAVVHALRPGTGLPLVLLHAFPLDHRMWADVAALLPAAPHGAATQPVLALDLPGLGAAQGVPLPAPSLDASADAVAAALAEAGHDRAVVAGLSMGGYVALALLERHPGLVAGIGLLDTKVGADSDEARANRLRVADAVESSGTVDAVLPMAEALLGEAARGRGVADRVRAWIEAQPPAGVAWSQRAMAARPDRASQLAELAGPALVLVGEEDQPTPVAEARRTADLLGVEPVVVPGAGHLTAVESPDAVAAALGELLGRAAAGR